MVLFVLLDCRFCPCEGTGPFIWLKFVMVNDSSIATLVELYFVVLVGNFSKY